LFWPLILQVVLISVNAIFACAEIAVISVNENKIAKLSGKGNKKAIRLSKMTAQPAKFLATIQVSITLAGYLSSAFAAENFSGRLAELFVRWGSPVAFDTLNIISLVMITVVLAYFNLVFGELVPKRLAMKYSEKLALGLANLIYFISQISRPIVWLLTVSTNGILRLLRINPHADDTESAEEEIKLMLESASTKGGINISEKEMIQNIFEFDDKTADEIMTHRVDTAILWLDEFDIEWEKTIHEHTHTHYPICDDNIDNIIGVLNTKQYFRLKDKSFDNVMSSAVKPAYFVPETVHTDILFYNMKQTRNHFAVVLDEYGGFTGIVTMNDLLEQIVGNLDDNSELPAEPPMIEQREDNLWIIQSETPLEDVAETLSVELPQDNADTFGGFAFGLIGYIPEDGTSHEINGYGLNIKIDTIEEHNFDYAAVSRIIEEPAPEK